MFGSFNCDEAIITNFNCLIFLIIILRNIVLRNYIVLMPAFCRYLFCFHYNFSLIPWYSSIDPELTSVRPKGQIPLRLTLHYVYPSTDCTMNGCAWIGGNTTRISACKYEHFLQLSDCISPSPQLD